MKKIAVFMAALIMLCGCAQLCEFGSGGDDPGLKCVRVFSKAEVGMTQKEVQDLIGPPQRRKTDVSYEGKTYDEVWIYETTPATILYFKWGTLEHKEYQQ
ncbi:MAG: hypothetical protein V1863_04225 [Candidatus Omnitrophota bacterium]